MSTLETMELLARHWPLRRAMRGFLYSLIPFGAFVFDRSLVREIASVEGYAKMSLMTWPWTSVKRISRP